MYYSPKTSTDGLVFHYDTGNTVRSYLGEPTTNLLPNGVAEVHDAASGNTVTVTDATTEKGPGWKKVTITARGSNFRTLQWTYLSMSANVTYTFSAVFDWGNMRGKNYFIYFDGNGTGARTYYRPGDYTNAGSELIDSTMPDGKFAGKILHSGTHTHSFFIGNSTTGVSGLNDYFYYKEFQAEAKSHPTQFTTGTRSATQGLKDLKGNSTIDLTNVSFDSNAQMTFDGTDDSVFIGTIGGYTNNVTCEAIFKTTSGATWKDIIAGGCGDILFTVNGSKLNFGAQCNSPIPHANFSTTDVNTGEWFHGIATYDGSTVKIYINGVLESTNNRSGNFTPSNMRIGSADAGSSEFFNGDLPIVKLYNRALTADEVQRNFNAVKSRFNIA